MQINIVAAWTQILVPIFSKIFERVMFNQLIDMHLS